MRNWRSRMAAVVVVAVAVAVVVSTALAHVERASYWPDRRPDKSIKPPAGGKVPAARSLYTALNRKLVGDTRVVCQANSSHARQARIGNARKNGYKIRPTEHRTFSKKAATRLLAINRALKKRCGTTRSSRRSRRRTTTTAWS